MQFTTTITILIAALLLFGCISAAQKAEEKAKVIVKNESTTKNETPADVYETKNASTEPPIKNASAANETNLTATTASPEANVSQNASASGIPVAYFYSLICPFCTNASIYIDELEQKYPISVQKYEIYYNETNFNLFKQYAYEYRLKPDDFAVPTVFINASYYGGPNIYGGLENKIQDLAKETKK